ncbi:MAG: tyrosine-type recombinase/integrase [Planctomycetes bacterium]|nr:tyrosine-type recombinase/integrase [Planctomycetota bacterium]
MSAEPVVKLEPKPVPEPTTLTVKALVSAFLMDAEMRLKASTVATYRHDLEEFAATFGKLEASNITHQAITKWLHGLKVNNTTKGIRIRSVSACFGWASKNDLIGINPVRKVSKPKSQSRAEQAIILDADHAKLMAVATTDFKLVLRVLHATGCRPGEVGKITADSFDAVNAVVKLVEHKSDKTGKPRLIFLPLDICELLKAQLARFAAGSLLRSKNGVAWTGRSITQAMMRLRRKTGIQSISYGYRHSFATTALSKGVPDAHVAALLGHSSTAMLHKHYSHLTAHAGVLRDALAKVKA